MNFNIHIDGEDYEIHQSFEAPRLFKVIHYSGVHNIVLSAKTNQWEFIDHRLGTHPIDLEKVGKAIEKEINNEG